MAEALKDDPGTREAIESAAADLDSRQAGLRQKGEVYGSGLAMDFTVPVEHIDAFRFGLLRELEHGGDWLKSQAKEARDEMHRAIYAAWHSPRERRDRSDPFLCIGGPLREIQHDADHLRCLGFEKPEGDVVLIGEPHALKHSLEAVVKRCAKEFSGTELGGDEMRQMGETVAWATGEAARLEAESARREAERGKEAA